MLPLVASLVLVALFAGTVGLGQMLGLPTPWTFDWSHHSATAMQQSMPTRISIPTIGVQAPVVGVGQAADGSIATPAIDKPDETGWYRLGPTPGERGTAVIVGHVDSADRPAVFARLATLSTGRTIEVMREDRRTATFRVESVQRTPKTAFPADRVFDAGNQSRLVLVTCGGAWVGGNVGYADNVIVYAALA
jgi:sortase (surface protein transpeptidase)